MTNQGETQQRYPGAVGVHRLDAQGLWFEKWAGISGTALEANVPTYNEGSWHEDRNQDLVALDIGRMGRGTEGVGMTDISETIQRCPFGFHSTHPREEGG